MIYPAPKHEPSPPKEQKRPRARNRKRQRSEFERAYEGRERIEWIKAQPCAGCGRMGWSVNAHTVTGGRSRKADYKTIAPLCGDYLSWLGCHKVYDQHLAPFDNEEERGRIKASASEYEKLWRSVADGGKA